MPTPPSRSPKYKESPALAEQVKAGKLPPVEQRLPSEPLVVPVVERVGQYGGVWRRAFLGPADANNYVRVVYDALVRHSPDGGKIEPKIAAGWESSKDFKQWTIKLRPGAKWSDGAPFTADDIVFWYQDVLLNKDLVPAAALVDEERRRIHGGGREGQPDGGALHVQAGEHAGPHRPGQRRRRRSDVRGVPAGSLPQEVPRRPT